MSIRITQGILYSQALADIQRSLIGSTRLQQQIATGLRVNRPSDDPAATLRIMPLTAGIRDLSQILDNVDVARESLNTGAASLEDASLIIQRVRELTMQGANGSQSTGDRQSLAQEIDQLLGQMIGIANTQRGGRFLFAGTNADQEPFTLFETSLGTRAAYSGNQDSLQVEVAPGIDTAINMPGDAIFQRHSRGSTVFGDKSNGTTRTGAASGAGFDTGIGMDQLQVGFSSLTVPGTVSGIAQGSGTTTALGSLNYTFTAPNQLSINGGPTTTVSNGDNSVQVGTGDASKVVSLNITLPIAPVSGTLTSNATLSLDGGTTSTVVDFSSTDVQVRDSFDDSVLNVDVSSITQTGTDLVTYEGTFDAFSTLIAIRDTLRNSSGVSNTEVSARLSNLLGKVDEAHNNVLDSLRSLGNKSQNMSLLQNRVEGLKLTSQESLSMARDVDVVESIIEFNRQETVYNAALRVGARVVQTSLLNFLR